MSIDLTVADELVVDDVSVHYGDAIAVDHVSLRVAPGEIVALLGANGAGKSSLLQAISGLVDAASGHVSVGGVVLDGTPADKRAQRIAHVPEGRRLFPDHSVRDNLLLAAYGSSRAQRAERLAYAERVLPRLADLSRRKAELLSGGEQQMVALGRGVMSPAKTLVIDELSLGLAPTVAQQFADTLLVLRDEGYAILLVEQYVTLALRVADRVVVLDHGRVVLEGTAAEVRSQVLALEEAYLGRGDVEATVVGAAEEDAERAELEAVREERVRERTTPPIVATPQPLAALVLSAVFVACYFFPWFLATRFDGKETRLTGWQIPMGWRLTPLILVGVVAVASAVRLRTGKPLGRPFASLAAMSGVVAALVMFARVWYLGHGLPRVSGATYTREWGLLIAFQTAGILAFSAIRLLGERVFVDRVAHIHSALAEPAGGADQ